MTDHTFIRSLIAVAAYAVAIAIALPLLLMLEPYPGWIWLGVAVAAIILAISWYCPRYGVMAVGLLVFWSGVPIFVIIDHVTTTEHRDLPLRAELALLLILLLPIPVLFSLAWGSLCVAIFEPIVPKSVRGDCCRTCGYDLRGHRHEKCPECGNAPKAGDEM